MSASYIPSAIEDIGDPDWVSRFAGHPTSGQWWAEYDNHQEEEDFAGDGEQESGVIDETHTKQKSKMSGWKNFVDKLFYVEENIPPDVIYPVRPESISQNVVLPSADLTLVTMRMDSGVYKIIEDTKYMKKCELMPAYFLIRPSKYSQTYSFVYDTEGMCPRPVSARPLYILQGILQRFSHANMIRLNPEGGAVSYRLSFRVNKITGAMDLSCQTEDQFFEVSLNATDTSEYLQVVKYDLTDDREIIAPGELCAITCGSRFVDNKCRQHPALLIDTKKIETEFVYLLYFAANYHRWAPKIIASLIKPAEFREPKVYKTVKYIDNVVDCCIKDDTNATVRLIAPATCRTLDGYKIIDDTMVVEDILTSFLIDYDFNEQLYISWEASAQRSMRIFNACTKRGTLPVDASRSRETRRVNWDLYDARNDWKKLTRRA